MNTLLLFQIQCFRIMLSVSIFFSSRLLSIKNSESDESLSCPIVHQYLMFFKWKKHCRFLILLRRMKDKGETLCVRWENLILLIVNKPGRTCSSLSFCLDTYSKISRFHQMIPPSLSSTIKFFAVMIVSLSVSVRKPNLSYSNEHASRRLLMSITRLSICVLNLSPALC